jgi:hypothetical protein
MKERICLIIIVILNTNLYSQTSKNRLVTNYYKGIEFYLSPDTVDFKREILFISKPSFSSPEYSVAVEKKGDSSMLKLRSFKSNYWELVFSNRRNDTVMVISKIDSFTVSVTGPFSDKLISIFQIVLQDDPDLNVMKFDVYDGTTYNISNKKYERVIRENNFVYKNYYNLVVLCESIANAIKTGDFKESFYFEFIDKTFSPLKK